MPISYDIDGPPPPPMWRDWSNAVGFIGILIAALNLWFVCAAPYPNVIRVIYGILFIGVLLLGGSVMFNDAAPDGCGWRSYAENHKLAKIVILLAVAGVPVLIYSWVNAFSLVWAKLAQVLEAMINWIKS